MDIEGRGASADADDASGSAGDVLLAAGGDVEAFIRLYRTHLTPVYRYLYARLGDRSDAEDVTQQVFERAWLSAGSYRVMGGGSFKGWLFTIARRAVADYFRGRTRRRDHLALDALAEDLPDPSPGPEEAAMLADQIHAVLRLIDDLPEEGREVVTLRFIADLSYREVAEIVGKNEAAVKMAAYRALEIIRRKRSKGDV